ncbi:MAG: 4-amino-4-deoxy-L-arabinose transferase-like glycosyltransferase [Cellvibrionaceae bacterium]|jgi:4-amino-4-deoxy-L-arabinose transferase-like glycosyltransferase
MKLSRLGRSRLLRLVILLTAAGLRLFGLSSAPPGLTHDEAVHGLSAWNIVTGIERPIYFAVANGREPLYDYMTAGVMAVLGPTWLAPRLVSAFFGIILVAATFALVRKLFSDRVALLTTATLALSFWPVMVSRHALRTITMPVFLVLGIYFWLLCIQAKDARGEIKTSGVSAFTPAWLIAGVMLGLSFYTYIPARIMWLLLPGMLAYWLIFQRDIFRVTWRPTLATLGTMGVIASPLLIFLIRHPEAESRISDLAMPLLEAKNGNWFPLLRNTAEGVRMLFTIGDSAWRYNISERALLLPIFAAFFGLGLLFIWRFKPEGEQGLFKNNAPAVFVLGWLILGMVPVFVTGPFLSTTQAVAIMPVLYIFPAVFIDWMWRNSPEVQKILAGAMIVFLFAYAGLDTVQSYFVDWATHPEVRLQYESVLFEAIENLDDNLSGTVAISVDAPGKYHDGAVGLLANNNEKVELKFFDGRDSLLIPAGDTFTLINSRLAPVFMFPAGEVSSEEGDFDGILNQIEIDGVGIRSDFTDFLAKSEDSLKFGDTVSLEAFQIRPDPGALQIGLLTVWNVIEQPATDLVLFTQILGPNGEVIAQADKLSVPTSSWGAGDMIVQLHWLPIPADIVEVDNPIVGSVMDIQQLIIGWYDPVSGQRLDLEINGESAGDFLELSQ